MAKLAIKGHKTRGKEIIEILKMMGGKNNNNCCGKFINRIYFIGVDRYIELCYEGVPENIFISFTLEEFLEKYPWLNVRPVTKLLYNRRVNLFLAQLTGVADSSPVVFEE